jgi:hypothetical protein
VKGLELLLERELTRGWGLRVNYTLQQATATSTSAFLLRRAIAINPSTGDTVTPSKVEFPLDYDRRHNVTVILQGQVPQRGGPRILGGTPFAGFEAAVIGRYSSGLPFTRFVGTETDSLLGLPNNDRLPAASTLDLLLRQPITVAGLHGGLYLDARNLLNRRNVVAVRRDTGTPFADSASVAQMAQTAYAAHPEAIPYESQRYRADADLDHDGYIAGRDELFPLYLAAARDYTQPLFAYGVPRQMRFGVEMLF